MTKKTKTDEESVFALCNSLNAWAKVMQHDGYRRVAELLLDAQHLITKLYCENHDLKEKLKEKED